MTARPAPPGRAGLVVDASAVVALLVDAGDDGQWAARAVRGHRLVAPHLMPYEAANVLRRLAAGGAITSEHAGLCQADLVALPVEFWPHELTAPRAWELRENVSVYDASYVSLAELLDLPLLTLDARLAKASGVRCEVLVP